MKFELKSYNRNTPEEDLLDDLRRAAVLFGGKITKAKYDTVGKFSSGTFENRFGTWSKALISAGLEVNQTRDLSEDKLFENLEEVWLKLGRQPKYDEFKAPLSKFSQRPYEKRFGSWYKALEKFVEVANADVPVSELEDEVTEVVDTSNAITQHKTKRDINWRMRFQVLSRDNFRCMSCGLSPAIAPGTILHVDHIKPWSKGGETVLENLQTLCATCNLGKSNIE
jgi:hypothetical protein